MPEEKPDNEPLSGLSHFIGLLLSIIALILMVIYATLYGNIWHIVSVSIYGSSLILLYLASTLYHLSRIGTKKKTLFKKIDHSMIFVLIAGSYTPICLIPLRGPLGWTLLVIIWSIALSGIIFKIFAIYRIKDWLSTLVYLLMGWLLVIVISPLAKVIPEAALWWLISGGILYTVGVVFLALDKKFKKMGKSWVFGMHEIFHLFVIAGSFSHFWMVFRYLTFI